MCWQTNFPARVKSSRRSGHCIHISSDGSENVDSSCGPIRYKRKSQVTNIRKSYSRRKGTSSRCHEHRLDGNERLRVSSVKTTVGGPIKDREPTLLRLADCSSMVSSVVVLGSDSLVDRSANEVASTSTIAEATRVAGFRPQPGNEKSPCLDSERKSLAAAGFSDEVVARIHAPQRASTRAIYSSKFRSFQSWARGHGVDERRLTLSQVSDFFLYLFQRRQLVPGTIQGYRTVLAEFIPRSVVDIRGSEELDRLFTGIDPDHPVLWFLGT